MEVGELFVLFMLRSESVLSWYRAMGKRIWWSTMGDIHT
jgi:hypothetical protein